MNKKSIFVKNSEHSNYQKKFDWKLEVFRMFCVGRQIVSLLISVKLKDEDVKDVIQAVGKILNAKV